METVFNKEKSMWKSYLLALVIVGLACALIFIAFGTDSIVPGVHDAFHDFRHAIGMPCH